MQDRGRQRFLERRRVARLAIAALVQRLARGVEAQHAAAVREVRHDDHPAARPRSTGGARPMLAIEDVADALAHLRDDLLRRHAAAFGVGAEALDDEAVLRVEQLAPADAPRLRVQHRRGLRRHFLDDAQDAARRPQLQVQLVEELVARPRRSRPGSPARGRSRPAPRARAAGRAWSPRGRWQSVARGLRAQPWQSAAREYNDAPRRAIPSGCVT